MRFGVKVFPIPNNSCFSYSHSRPAPCILRSRVSNDHGHDHNLKLEFWRPCGRLVDLVDQGGPEGFSIGNGAMTKILRVQKCGNWLIGGWSIWQHAKMDNQLKPTRYQVIKIGFIQSCSSISSAKSCLTILLTMIQKSTDQNFKLDHTLQVD